jgi:hypothetical protein
VVRLQALLALCGSVVGVLLTQWATVQNDLAHAMKMRLGANQYWCLLQFSDSTVQ